MKLTRARSLELSRVDITAQQNHALDNYFCFFWTQSSNMGVGRGAAGLGSSL